MKRKKNKKYPKVSILITHKNGKKILDGCLNSLRKTNYPNFEILVLLNATTDKSPDIAKKHKVKVYKSEKNLGFAGGDNFLIRRTDSEYIVIMNNDVEVDKNWLKELVNFAERTDADGVQPKILSLRNKKMFEYAGAAGGFIDKYGYPFCRGRIFNEIEMDKGQYNSPVEIFWACGACMMIKREILKKTGILDEDFFMYGEELDLCWRINLVGGKIFNVPSSVVYHLGKYSIKKEKLAIEQQYLLHRNVLLMFLKNYSNKTLIRLIFPRIFLEVSSALAFPEKIYPVAKSFIWIAKNLDKIKNKHKEIQKLRKLNDEEIQKRILKKSIAYLFFIKNKKTFRDIEKNF